MAMTRDEALRTARGLGWFSVGLGVVELLAPHALARATGTRHDPVLVRACGVRELATGIGLLFARDPEPWLWARVGGDALDAAALAAGRTGRDDDRWRTGVTLAAVVGVTAVDIACARALHTRATPIRDDRDRSGWPEPAEAMRGRALPFDVPADLRVPELLRPYPTDGAPA